MDAKKDPGKFTIRFCMSDPRQRRAVAVLNEQGRLKAQFLTNAILHYVDAPTSLPPREELEPMLEQIVKRILDEHEDSAAENTAATERPESLTADSLTAIMGTLRAFRR